MPADPLPLPWAIAVFAASAAVLVVVGVRFTRVVDRLADRTGLGEALAGAVLVGATTSLPGLITTTVGAAHGRGAFAVSNALGGIAAQTMFLALADLTYRRANLEHAAASIPNLLQAILLMALVGLVLLGTASPEVTWLGVHPVTPLLVVAYCYGLHLTRLARKDPMWRPRMTRWTRRDVPDEASERHTLGALWAQFGAMAAVVAATGFAVAHAGESVIDRTELGESVVGGLFTSVVTSLPELITVLVAVRIGALTLAVGNIIGGNTFDVLFVAAGDVAFRGGSIYHAVDRGTIFLLGLAVVMTSVLTAGLVHREAKGIGFEGVALLALYAAGVVVLLSL